MDKIKVLTPRPVLQHILNLKEAIWRHPGDGVIQDIIRFRYWGTKEHVWMVVVQKEIEQMTSIHRLELLIIGRSPIVIAKRVVFPAILDMAAYHGRGDGSCIAEELISLTLNIFI
ncbi:hypothetical protein KC332_g11 [Hortaea werneckii]|nr:hypothetical protein KC348_g16 [Hortaea werneckii]KAI7421945.1 hypothetical protein KC332_g11 [Hortaea werneckii]